MTHRFMLDTNMVSDLITNRRGMVARKIRQVGVDAVSISAVVAAELRFGYLKRASGRLKGIVEDAIGYMPVLPFTDEASVDYASIRCDLMKRGLPIGPNDLFIAAHARALDLTLVTNNIREFSHVDGLKLENWLEGGTDV